MVSLRPKKQVSNQWEHRSLTWLYSTRWSRPMAWYRLCCLLPNQQALAASQRCGWVRGWRSPVASVEGWRRIRFRGSLLPTATTSCLAVASCCHPTASDLRYLSNKIYEHNKKRTKIEKQIQNLQRLLCTLDTGGCKNKSSAMLCHLRKYYFWTNIFHSRPKIPENESAVRLQAKNSNNHLWFLQGFHEKPKPLDD